jgi:hypothetical protein
MRPAKHFASFVALISIGLLFISQGCSAAAQSGVVNSTEPIWYKISIESQATLNLQVNATNVTANSSLWVVLAIGITPNVGDTPTVALTVINRTQNTTLTYQHVHTTPLYLLILYYPDVNSSTSVAYIISCSHPIVPYSYQQYYDDVVYPDIVQKTTLVGLLIGSLALIVTIYMLKRRHKEKASSLM